MTFLEELRREANNARQDKRYKELLAKGLADRQALDDLQATMLKAAKDGNWSLAVPIDGLASSEWRPVYSKDYRSRDKARFDQELCEFLSLHFEGVHADSLNRSTIRLSWR